MEAEVVCNFKKCRKRLSKMAWVTSCSHIFCDEDGAREFNKKFVCPACETTLGNKLDIIHIDLQPSEQYKSMMLAGHRPETILEIASRAQAFWTYQCQQERIYQEAQTAKANQRCSEMENYYEQIQGKITAQLNSMKRKLNTKSKELETMQQKYNEVSDALNEKNAQISKLQSMYDSLRRKCVSSPNESGNHQRSPFASPYFPRSATRGSMLTTGSDLITRHPSVPVDAAAGAGDGGMHPPFLPHSRPGSGMSNNSSESYPQVFAPASQHPQVYAPAPQPKPGFSPRQREFVLRPRATPTISLSESDSEYSVSARPFKFNPRIPGVKTPRT